MTAVLHAALVTGEHHRGERLRPDRHREKVIAENALLDQFAQRFDFAVVRCLAIVLHQARRKARGLAPVLEAGARQRLAQERGLIDRQDVADHDLHAFAQRIGIVPNSAKVYWTGPVFRPYGARHHKANRAGVLMKSKTKTWLGVGAFVVAGVNGAAAERPMLDRSVSKIALTRALAPTDVSAAKRGGGEGGEQGERGAKKAKKKQGAEGGEGGAKDANLPPDLDFALKIAQIRGHLLVGDELVKQGEWAAALPHFLHPSEELYGPIRGRLKDYNTPQFASALKSLANAVKQKKGGDDYSNAGKQVEDALAAADAGVKAKQASDGFVVETALELLKSATGEYKQAIVKGRIAKPVEYQDARGFVWQAEKMIKAAARGLEKKNADALKQVRAGFAELKQAWPAAMPPQTPVKDYAALLSDVSRIELSIGKLM